MKKYILMGGVALFAFVFSASFSFAAAPNWNVTGTYNINVNYLNADYPETLVLTQSGENITGVSLDTVPAGSFFTVTGGSVSGDDINIYADNGSPNYHVHMIGTIAPNGLMSGTWHDENPGTRSGKWNTISGVAKHVSPTNKDQCKKDGWKVFNDPAFKNQGQCVSYVATRYSTFTAGDSLYYNCPIVCSSIYGTGPISFTWDKKTGEVLFGKYDELVGSTEYHNMVTSGSVSNTGAVNLTFDRVDPNIYHFIFTGSLSGDTLTGNLDGPYFFTATGN